MGESAGAGGSGGGRERAMEQETGREAGIRQSAQPVQASPAARAIGARADTRPSTPAEREELNRQLDRMLTQQDTFDAYQAAQRQNLADIERIRGIGADVFGDAGVSAPPMRPQVQGPAARVTPSLAEMGTLGLDRMIGGSRSGEAQAELQSRASLGDAAAREALNAAIARGDIAGPQTPVGRSPKELMERVGITTIEPRTLDIAQTPVSRDPKESMERGDISAERVLNIAQTPVSRDPKELMERGIGSIVAAGPGLGTFTTGRAGEVRPGATGETYGFASPTDLSDFRSDVARIGRGLAKTPSIFGVGLGRTVLSPQSFTQAMDDFIAKGARYNPETDRLELPTGRGMQTMNRFGNLTYSGPREDDPNQPQPGLGAMGFGPDEAVVQEPVVEAQDPCPDGYTLVDGVCQPISPIDTAPDTRFTLPATPMSFQPTTVATPVQQINPFVLSPTGAALGRSI